MNNKEFSSRLADFVVKTSYDDIPDEVIHQAVRCLLDWFGNACGGVSEPGTRILLNMLQDLGSLPQASVVGTDIRLSVDDTSFINGYSAHVIDFDDTHTPTVLHPTSPVMSSAAAMAELMQASGKELLLAYVLGVEVAVRLAQAISPSHYKKGWHITGTAGTIGAAVAAAKLHTKDIEEMLNAIGIAATQASGHRVQFGTMAKAFNSANAAANGIQAALLAARGFTSSSVSLEGINGFIQAMSETEHPLEQYLEKIGEDYRLCDISFKPYCCGVVAHGLIDAVIQIRNEHNVSPGNIRSIHARLSDSEPLPQLQANPDPKTGLSGKFSLAHCAAVALVDGDAGVNQFTDERVNDPVIRDLRKIFTATLDETVGEKEAYVTVHLKDRQKMEIHITAHTGTPENPMQDAELESKFRSQAGALFPQNRLDNIIDAIWNVTRAGNFGELVQLLAQSSND